jgi:hypothetical protein
LNYFRRKEKTFQNCKKRLENYEQELKKLITLDSFNTHMLRGFERFLLSDKKKTKGRNTFHTIMKMTRSFWNFVGVEMKSYGVELTALFGKIRYKLTEEVYVRPIYISDAERDTIYKAELDDERLQWVRDIFISQCHVGASIGDLMRFTIANVNNGMLTYIAHKTKDNKPITISVQLTDIAKEIISKYDIPESSLLPFRS